MPKPDLRITASSVLHRTRFENKSVDVASIVKHERYTSEELIQFCVGVLSKFKKEVKRLHKYLCAIGNGVAIFKQLDLTLKTDQFKKLEKLENLSSMIYPLLLVEV